MAKYRRKMVEKIFKNGLNGPILFFLCNFSVFNPIFRFDDSFQSLFSI
jgi:hypothetical protein